MAKTDTAATAVELDAAERASTGPASRKRGMVAPSAMRATSPINGEPVTFIMAEQLPEWAAELLVAGRGTVGEDGIITLPPVGA